MDQNETSGGGDKRSRLSQYVHCASRDLASLPTLLKNERLLKKYNEKDVTVADAFRNHVKATPMKACILYEDRIWTFQDLEEYSNRIGNLFQKEYGLRKGDCVAILVENCPEFIGIWLGLSKIGVISAFINTNLKSQQLVHTVTSANAKVLICCHELEAAIIEIKDQLDPELKYLIFGSELKQSNIENVQILETLVEKSSKEIVKALDKLNHKDVMFYIYTSGTTGLPKPAIIKNDRYFLASIMFHRLCKLDKNDIVYIPLPLYHSNATLIGTGNMIISGSTIVIRKKFSATNFWKDCVKYNCTVFVYVGEICRFLMNQPASELDRQHNVKKAIGNGLRKNVWEEFEQRFNVKFIEFYGSSEGNCNMINTSHKVGACGFVPLINKYIKVLPLAIIKIDENMNPIRNEKGFCIECETGEKGLLVGMINKKSKSSFNGYANNEEATNKKIIENVFKKGQRAFNSGDLMMRDKYGYMYFCDRLGDTYRWRGENVSTIEVENVIASILNAKEVVVYGVEVPGEEGKAGMAAVASTVQINFSDLEAKLRTALPSYSRPLFIRLTEEIEYTGTFKVKKTTLIEQGYDPNKLSNDKVFYLDTKSQKYTLLTPADHQKIISREIRF